MATAAPARKLEPRVAPEPARSDPPEPKKRPRDRPRPGGQGRSSATASVAAPAPPKRKTGTTKRRKSGSGSGRKGASGGKGPTDGKGPSPRAAATASPIRRVKSSPRAGAATAAPARKSPARKSPARKVAPRRRPAGVIPIAAGTAVRGAVAITQLPESGLIHRLTRGRAWIGLLGVLLVGIVALNVVTLSFAASAGKVDERIQELSKENSMLQNRVSEKFGTAKIAGEAKKLGLGASTMVNPKLLSAHGDDVAKAAARLSAAAPDAAEGSGAEGASTEGEAATGAEGSATGEEAATSESLTTGEEAGGEAAESEFTPEELEIYEREYAELLASEGAG